jgi:hypothetical protein
MDVADELVRSRSERESMVEGKYEEGRVVYCVRAAHGKFSGIEFH